MKRSQFLAAALAVILGLAIAYLPEIVGAVFPSSAPSPVQIAQSDLDPSGTDVETQDSNSPTQDGKDTNQGGSSAKTNDQAPPSDGQDNNSNSDKQDGQETTGTSGKQDNGSGKQDSGSGKQKDNSKKNDNEQNANSSDELPIIADGIVDATARQAAAEKNLSITEDGWYTSKEEVAFYIHTYNRLPGNFISKTKAKSEGWVNTKGNLDEVCPGMSIGGSVFYNEGWEDEALLPEKKGRTWTECDINYHGGYRGAERIVFSNDGLIFYTADHYKTYEQLY